MANARFLVSRTVLLLLLCAVFGVTSALSQRVFRAVLDGTQETPPVTATTAAGTGTVELNVAENSIAVTMSFSGLSSNQTAAHIHGNSARGVSSGVLFNIGSSGTTSGTFSFNQAVTPTDIANLKAGLWYFNVHSSNFPGGEIRGQIEPDCANLPTGLVSWYRGEGNTLDQNALNNGTSQGSVTYVGGRSGRTLRLGGNGNAGNSGDRVIVGNPANLQLQDFTIEAWIRRQSSTITTNSPVAGSENGTIFAYGQNGYGLVIIQSSGLLALTKIQADQITSTGPAITDTNFHHVAVTKSGNQVLFYVDGVASAPISYGSTFAFTSNAAIGARGDSDARNAFFGDVDELSIFNRALSIAEIASIYNAGAAGKCPPCVATPVGLAEWWTADGNLFGSRNLNNAAFLGGATFAEGINGHGYLFGGGGQTAEAPDSATLDVTTQFTFDAWINPAILHNGIGQGAVFSKIGGPGGNNGFQFGINNNNTQIFCQFNATGEPWPTNQLIANVPAGGLPLNTWSHIACTYNNADLKIYLDGMEIGSLNVGPKTVVNSAAPLRISGDSNNNVYFTGRIDEPHVFNRALSATEIAAVVNAGRSCFCKPGATNPPSNLIGWWGGDGDARDVSGFGNNGTLIGGTGFSVGKVGQSLNFDGIDDYVQTNLDIQPSAMPNVTFEAWVYPRNATGFDQAIFSGDDGGWDRQIGISPSGTTFRAQTGSAVTFDAGTVDYNQWQHIAVVYSPSDIKIYKNGVEFSYGSAPTGQSSINKLALGSNRCPPCVMNGFTQQYIGLIDEASVYSRALSLPEIRSIYVAGLAGKLKQFSTVFNPFTENKAAKERNLGSFGPVVPVGDATIFFQGTSVVPGYTQLIPIQQSKLPPLPTQWQGLTYDISTAWQYTGITSVCFNVPSFTPAQFSSLRIYHLESDNWVNRTNPSSMYPNLCTNSLPSLSPFAIGNLIPNAANVNVGGRVVTAGGNGVSNAVVYFTDSQGVTRTARTGSLGYFKFDDVLAGETYVVVINHKRYTFTPRVVTVEDEITELDFVAIE